MSGEICPKCLHDDVVKASKGDPDKDGERRQRWICKRCNFRTVNPLDQDDPRLSAGEHKFRQTLPKSEIYVITCAQNATDLHPTFQALVTYCTHNKAELIVIPIRYTNPTSHWGASAQAQDWWETDLHPYLFTGRKKMHKHLVVMGDIMTQLTAARPTQRFETITGAHSGIIGHPKQELQYIATPQQTLPKALMTTGACTVRNYIPSKAGAAGAHHHTFGAIVVEKDGDRFHFRQLNAINDGSFIDIDKKYSPDGTVEKAGPVPLLVCGDLHERFACPKAIAATLTDKDSMLNVLKPKRIAWHDVMDGYAANPHDRDNPFMKVARYDKGYSNIKEEIKSCAKFFDLYIPKDVENYVVASNHEDFLSRWMNWVDWRHDPENAEFYLETALEMVREGYVDDTGYKGIHPFPLWMKRFVEKANMTYLGIDESFTCHGIEAGFHGHRGPNGAKGSLQSFGKIGVRTIIGHSHTPGIRDGAFQVGTMSQLVLDYTSGPSSWLNTNGVVYENGKRALLNIIDGRWRK